MPAQPLPPEAEPQFAHGSQPVLVIPEISASRTATVKVVFGDLELTIEHRGNDVAIVIPGALRLTAPRAHAMALIAALIKRP